MTETAVIIVNLNGMDHIETCLGSLFRQTYSDCEVILVDNGSTDGSLDFVRRNFPKVKVLRLEKNTGFAFATNRGIVQTSSPYIALLNNDIELEAKWLQNMVDVLKNHPQAGATACKMLNFFDRGIIDAAGDVLTRAITAEARGHGEQDFGQYDMADYVFGPCAGAAVYRREVFDQIGFFDERFFAFYEDIDLDFRMQSGGWKVMYVPSAVCFHKRGATVRTMQRMAVKLHVRNSILFVLKNVPSRTIVRRLPSILTSRLRAWFAYSRKGHTAAVLQGMMEAVMRVPEMLSERKAIQAQRKVTVEYIESLMEFGASPTSWPKGTDSI
ncbi:MAG TPA: glycosyltransferase family 2 protein [Bacteroidota bacterium]|nr:glycosyltransferase family 2 protein [Bacteroidota bacterium]